jgi:hypothetical protein
MLADALPVEFASYTRELDFSMKSLSDAQSKVP